MSDEKKRERHPSFVIAGFSRVTGGDRKFFGSSVRSSSYIEFRAYEAELENTSGYDRIGRSGSLPLIEIAFSPAQFAELLTTMNVGEGTPGTLKYFNKQDVAQAKDMKIEAERSYEHLKGQLKERMQGFRDKRAEILKILEDKPTINKGDRQRLASLLENILMEINSNLPFYFQLVEEGVVKMVTQAKAEVDSFITAAVQKTGLAALRGNSPHIELSADSPLAIESKADYRHSSTTEDIPEGSK